MVSSIPSSTGPKQAVILVIDADPVGQRSTRERLTNLGYSARSVDDYSAALTVLASTPPDVVILAQPAKPGETWNSLQLELNKWGIPVVTLDTPEDTMSTGFLPDATPKGQSADLKLRVDAAVSSRTLQEALLTENARLTAERLHDPLTGLYNRRYMIIRIEEEILRSTRRGHPLSCMLVDINGFDRINETWGHAVGDAVLRDMAHLVTRTLRGSDIVCRYRDDQYLALLTDTDAAGAQIAANRMRDAVTEYKFVNPMAADPLELTVSVGVAYWQPATKPGQGGTWEPQLLGLCERALKAAKQSGANRLVILQAS